MDKIMTALPLLLAGAAGVYYFFFLRENKKKKMVAREETAGEFINVQDIVGTTLYTLDGCLMKYIRVFPIAMELFSDREQEILTQVLTSTLSGIPGLTFKFLAVSRPIDLSPVIGEHQEILSTSTNSKQRELLRKEILELSAYATKGEAVERQFYFVLSGREKYKEALEERAIKLAEAFTNNNIEAQILERRQIIQLGYMVNHPQYVPVEGADVLNVVPMLKEKRGKENEF